jgi:DNA-binding Lrp family transcriptional regulator
MSKIGTRTLDLLEELLKEHPSNVETLARRVGIKEREIYRELQDWRDHGIKFEEGLKRGMYQLSRANKIFEVVLKREVRSEPISLDPTTTDKETIKMTKHGEEIFTKLFDEDAPAMVQKFISRYEVMDSKHYSFIRDLGLLTFGSDKSEKIVVVHKKPLNQKQI